jgi:hypothetical protein
MRWISNIVALATTDTLAPCILSIVSIAWYALLVEWERDERKGMRKEDETVEAVQN